MFPPDVISSHFDAGNPGCLSRDFLVARARSGAGGPPSSSSSSSSSNRIDFRSRERYHPSTRREFDERPALVAHAGCTRARTCIALKNGPTVPFFFSHPPFQPIEESIFRTTRIFLFFWTSAHRFGTAFIVLRFFRSDSDRG